MKNVLLLPLFLWVFTFVHAQDKGISITVSSGIGATLDHQRIEQEENGVLRAKGTSLRYGAMVPIDLHLRYEAGRWRLGLAGGYRYVYMGQERLKTDYSPINGNSRINITSHIAHIGIAGGYDLYKNERMAIGIGAEVGYFFFAKWYSEQALAAPPQLYGSLACQGSYQLPVKGLALTYSIGLSVQVSRYYQGAIEYIYPFSGSRTRKEVYYLPEAKIGIRKTFAIAGKRK